MCSFFLDRVPVTVTVTVRVTVRVRVTVTVRVTHKIVAKNRDKIKGPTRAVGISILDLVRPGYILGE